MSDETERGHTTSGRDPRAAEEAQRNTRRDAADYDETEEPAAQQAQENARRAREE